MRLSGAQMLQIEDAVSRMEKTKRISRQVALEEMVETIIEIAMPDGSPDAKCKPGASESECEIEGCKERGDYILSTGKKSQIVCTKHARG